MASGDSFNVKLPSTLLYKSTCGSCRRQTDPKDMKFCTSCPAWLCPSCVFVHQTLPALKTHQLQDAERCENHSCRLKYYCHSCSTLVCAECRLDGAHVGHECMDINTKVEENKEKSQDDMKELRNLKTDLKLEWIDCKEEDVDADKKLLKSTNTTRTMAAEPSNYSHTFKYIVIGDTGVGKSSLLHQFTDKEFTDDCPSTIGVGFRTKIVEVSGQNVRLQIWDTAGQERFKALTRNYYRGAVGVLILYDITRRSSYDHLGSWLKDVKDMAHPKTVIFLIGNKSDLQTQREITYKEGKRFADENGLLFRECSAKIGDVEDAFLETAKGIYQHIQDGNLDLNATDPGVQLETQPKSQNKGCYC